MSEKGWSHSITCVFKERLISRIRIGVYTGHRKVVYSLL